MWRLQGTILWISIKQPVQRKVKGLFVSWLTCDECLRYLLIHWIYSWLRTPPTWMAAVWFVLLTHHKYKQNPVSFIQGWPKMSQNCEPSRCGNPVKISSNHGGVYSRRYLGVLRSSRKIKDIQEQQIKGPDRLPVYLWHLLKRLVFFGHPPSNPAREENFNVDPRKSYRNQNIWWCCCCVKSRLCCMQGIMVDHRSEILIMGWFADFSSPNPWSLPSDMVAFPKSL